MNYYPALIEEAMMQVRYPGTGKNLIESGMLADDVRIEGKKVSFSLLLKKNDPFGKSLVKAAEMAIKKHLGDEVDIEGNIQIKYQEAEKPLRQENALVDVKHVIAIASGKGGVGKSTVAVNLAVALASKGHRVGLLDADVYGPSIPKMFGVEGARPVGEDINGKSKIKPIEKYGVKLVSMGFFTETNQALIWRGAMAHQAIKQLVNDVAWGMLDYLLIDLPPGTGDVHLSVAQELNLSGGIVVSTPQDVALADVRKGIDMFENKNIQVPILGLIENMAWFTPDELPDKKYFIFGEGGVSRLATELNLPLLAQIPIWQGVREAGDDGKPFAIANDSRKKEVYFDLISAVEEGLNKRASSSK